MLVQHGLILTSLVKLISLIRLFQLAKLNRDIRDLTLLLGAVVVSHSLPA